MSGQEHWEDIYRRKGTDEVSWYQPHLERSLRLIEGTGLPRAAAIIDVGGGASTLVDDLLGRGYGTVTVLDLSAGTIEPSSTSSPIRPRAAVTSRPPATR